MGLFRKDNPEEEHNQAILGFRLWDIKENKNVLCSFGVHSAWSPGLNYATRSPGSGEHTGFNAFYYCDQKTSDSIYMQNRSDTVVWGIVVGAQNVHLHDGGWRSEEAQVVGLYCPDFISSVHRKTIERLAQRYEVPVLYNYTQVDALIDSLDVKIIRDSKQTIKAVETAVGIRVLEVPQGMNFFQRLFYQTQISLPRLLKVGAIGLAFMIIPFTAITAFSIFGEGSGEPTLNSQIAQVALAEQKYYKQHLEYTKEVEELATVEKDIEKVISSVQISISTNEDASRFLAGINAGSILNANQLVYGDRGKIATGCPEEFDNPAIVNLNCGTAGKISTEDVPLRMQDLEFPDGTRGT